MQPPHTNTAQFIIVIIIIPKIHIASDCCNKSPMTFSVQLQIRRDEEHAAISLPKSFWWSCAYVSYSELLQEICPVVFEAPAFPFQPDLFDMLMAVSLFSPLKKYAYV